MNYNITSSSITGIGEFTNETYAILNFNTSAIATSGVTINNSATFNINNASEVDGNIINSATMQVSDVLTGSGSLNNTGNVIIAAGAALNITGSIVNAGNLSIAADFTPASYSSFTSPSGSTIGLINAGNIIGALNVDSGASLLIGQDAIGNSGNANFTANDPINIGNITVYSEEYTGSSFDLAAALTGGGTISVSNNASMTLSTNATTDHDIDNEGVFAITGSNVINTGNINNGYGGYFSPTLTITGSISGSGSITNSGGNAATIILDTNAVIGNDITNDAFLDVTGSNVLNNALITNTATMTITGSIAGTGSIANNLYGSLILDTNAVVDNPIDNLGTLNVTGSNVINNAAITTSNSMDITGSISGSGTITNLSNGFLTLDSNTVNSLPITNLGNLYIIGSNVVNNSSITNDNGSNTSLSESIYGPCSLSGTGSMINNAGATLTIGTSTSTYDITNSGTITIIENFDNTGTITNNNSMSISGNITDSGIINNTGTIEIGSNSEVDNQINNLDSGILNVDSILIGNVIVNTNAASTINVNNALSANTSLTNNGIINLASYGSIGSTLTNNAGTLFANGGEASEIDNNATVTITQPLSMNGNFNNNNIINMGNAINMNYFTFNNNTGGILNVSGTQSITNGTYVSPGTMNFTITSASVNDSLTADANFDISNGAVNVTSGFSGTIGVNYCWDILTTTSGAIITNSGTAVNIPASTGVFTWSSEFVNSDSILRVLYLRTAATPIPLPGIDTEIANVLAAMQANITNTGQQELIDIVNSVSSQDQYNYLLSNLQPDTNSSASSTTLAMQNMGFNKIEVRVSNATHNKSSNENSKSGVATGDLTHNVAMWLSGVGSISKQQAKGDTQGYRAKILGFMVGVDTRIQDDDILGLAFGTSNANIYGLENDTTMRILGYNLMVYGGTNFKQDFFAEWIVSGVINKNHGIKVFGINGSDLSTVASYRGDLLGIRANFGKYYNINNDFMLSQVNSLQYVLVHQPSYDETGSVAALHVSTQENQSILTIGTGIRVGIFNNNEWLQGNRELHAMLTYDVITPDQTTTANFVVGSDAFTMTSSPARLALKLGVDYSFTNTVYENLNLDFSYNYEIRSGYYDNFGEIKLRYLF